MSDRELILAELHDGEWHNIVDISRSCKPGAVNWAVRSRVSDLKKRGHEIQSRRGENGCAEYRLVQKPDSGFTETSVSMRPAQAKFECEQIESIIGKNRMALD